MHRDPETESAAIAVQVQMAARALLILALGALLCAGPAAAARTLQQTADASLIADALNSVAADPPTAAALVSTRVTPQQSQLRSCLKPSLLKVDLCIHKRKEPWLASGPQPRPAVA